MKKNNINLSLSILEANFFNLGKQLNEILSYGINSIHIDAMDNNYVPNLTFGPCILNSLRKNGIKNDIHVHLMSYNVDNIIMQFIKYGADIIILHPETSNHILRSINIIKENNCKCGIAINPTTSLDVLDYLIDYVDMILVMSVIPGFSNQKFIKNTLFKINNIKKLIDKKKLDIILAVDGGINPRNIKSIILEGADTVVIGSYIFKENNYKKNIELILNEIY